MLKWRLSQEAQTDMSDIRAFTKKYWGVDQSKRYIKAIQERIELLAQNPYLGANRSLDVEEGIRSFLVGTHTIYYQCDTKTLTIWAILHQARTPRIHLLQKETHTSADSETLVNKTLADT
jgi:toxin ParE1/3/4